MELSLDPHHSGRERIVAAICGPTTDYESPYSLDRYLEYWAREVRHATVLGAQTEIEKSIIPTFEVLKSNTNKTRHVLENELHQSPLALDLCCRLMLMTGCQTPGTVGGDIFRPRWRDDENLGQYISRVYPRASSPADDSRNQPVSLNKLGADFLTRYAHIDIRWTDRLTDHLTLLKGSDWKSLYVFAHPSFLLRSLEAVATQREPLAQGGKSDSSKPYACYLPPGLLQETLLTLELLFPPVGDVKSRRIINTEVTRHNLDPSFLQPFQSRSLEHQSPEDAKRPADVKDLYKKFPFWAVRLQNLWEEADNPSPLTYIGKLTDRNKSPRFTYWCTVVGITIAIMFGVMSSLLGALQVWISYCSWMGDPGIRGCSLAA